MLSDLTHSVSNLRHSHFSSKNVNPGLYVFFLAEIEIAVSSISQ